MKNIETFNNIWHFKEKRDKGGRVIIHNLLNCQGLTMQGDV